MSKSTDPINAKVVGRSRGVTLSTVWKESDHVYFRFDNPIDLPFWMEMHIPVEDIKLLASAPNGWAHTMIPKLSERSYKRYIEELFSEDSEDEKIVKDVVLCEICGAHDERIPCTRT